MGTKCATYWKAESSATSIRDAHQVVTKEARLSLQRHHSASD